MYTQHTYTHTHTHTHTKKKDNGNIKNVNQGYSWNEIIHDYFPSKSFSVFSVFYNVCVLLLNNQRKKS